MFLFFCACILLAFGLFWRWVGEWAAGTWENTALDARGAIVVLLLIFAALLSIFELGDEKEGQRRRTQAQVRRYRLAVFHMLVCECAE